MTSEFLSDSPEATRDYARQFAATLQPGDIICLAGELGAGKTEFMRGITEVFNCDDQLSSPTFALFNIYHGSLRGKPVTLHHFDLYRIEKAAELETIGFSDYLAGPHISVVEWGDKFPEYRTMYTRTVTLRHAGNDVRLMQITGSTP
ncbi:MAG: tRNA (adenosine(37)-N6)-threonylcarbamoyltransferase complex ATPase subunit type 1 TsaE [Chlorobiaceae bacterium]|nr:tRNA (adenosine(37)-N6)-threonylcarbamoyltransferase complex ATPase subunit type 1 TsaE [Chlorobiaceae bacterium]